MATLRLAAVDAGNDAVKAVFGTLRNRLWIPNIIAEEKQQRPVIELERDPLDGLHVEIVSNALKSGGGTYVVGNLATTHPLAQEVGIETVKSDSDQNIIVALTALAIDAVQNFADHGGVIDAAYHLACGLPLTEVKQGKKQRFADRLKGRHEVRFLDTPWYKGKTVRIRLEEVVVFAEGHAGMVDLTTDDQGNLRSPEFGVATILVADIGGQTSDVCIADMSKGGKLDNYHSDSLREGVSPYLDVIAERVSREIGDQVQYHV